MKIYRYCHPKLNIDIAMPSLVFWLFKRYAKIKASETDGVSGRSIDMIIIDEVSE